MNLIVSYPVVMFLVSIEIDDEVYSQNPLTMWSYYDWKMYHKKCDWGKLKRVCFLRKDTSDWILDSFQPKVWSRFAKQRWHHSATDRSIIRGPSQLHLSFLKSISSEFTLCECHEFALISGGQERRISDFSPTARSRWVPKHSEHVNIDPNRKPFFGVHKTDHFSRKYFVYKILGLWESPHLPGLHAEG